MKPELLVLGSVWSKEVREEIGAAFACHYFDRIPHADDAALAAIAPAIRAVLTTGTIGIDANLAARLPALEIVSVHGVGVDAVALAPLAARGIHVTNTPDVLTEDVADFAVTLLLAAVRRPYLNPADADSRVVFAHELTLADGIYLTGSVSPYTEVVSALQANDGELLRVQIRRRERYEQELAYDTQIVEDDTLDFGKSETVQTGVPGRETVTYEVVYENGAEVDSRVLDVARTAEPVPEVIRRGTRLQSGMIGKLGTGSFIWPVPAYRHISRWANFTPGVNYHQGVDIAAPYGTEIYAADAGTVVASTYHWSWGNYVKIDHGNGYQTLYAHMSAQAVHVGDVVEQGQVIGYVGNTGNSFGNHCHFEMYYNERLFSARDVFPDMPEWNR